MSDFFKIMRKKKNKEKLLSRHNEDGFIVEGEDPFPSIAHQGFKAMNDVAKIFEAIKQPKRISWYDYYLSMAIDARIRSHDEETWHGCIITDKNFHLMSAGYNGLPRKGNYKEMYLPRTRPDKYPFMIHSERNALANCKQRPEGGYAFVTGHPCNDCLMAMWQHGIETVVYLSGYSLNKQATNYNIDNEVKERFLEVYDMKLIEVEPNEYHKHQLAFKHKYTCVGE